MNRDARKALDRRDLPKGMVNYSDIDNGEDAHSIGAILATSKCDERYFQTLQFEPFLRCLHLLCLE
jgi:hypothetical protein